MEEFVRFFIVVKRPWALFEVISGKEEEQFARCSDHQLCTLDAATIRICENFFSLVAKCPSAVSTALRTFAEDFLEEIITAMISSQFFSRATKKD